MSRRGGVLGRGHGVKGGFGLGLIDLIGETRHGLLLLDWGRLRWGHAHDATRAQRPDGGPDRHMPTCLHQQMFRFSGGRLVTAPGLPT